MPAAAPFIRVVITLCILMCFFAPAQGQGTTKSLVTPEQRKFVADQLEKMRVKDAFSEATPAEPKVILKGFLERGIELIPALREAEKRESGRLKDVCSRAITMLSWGFDPEEKIADALVKLTKGKPMPAGATRTALADATTLAALPQLAVFKLTFGEDPKSAKPVPPIEPLKTNNLLLLSKDGSVTTLSSTKQVEAFFKQSHKPATSPAAAPPPVDEAYIRNLFTTWLTFDAMTASDGKTTFKPAFDSCTYRQNGPRWVATGRYIPVSADAELIGQRQLLVVFGPDGSVLTTTETLNLKPPRK